MEKSSPLSEMYQLSTEVRQTLEAKGPVVALESTIITHGLPYPQNIETALVVEQAVRNEGAVPATIGILNGKIHVGLTTSELEWLGKPNPENPALKLSQRDLAYALALKKRGGTTVAATLVCAAQAGISVFATGGIGGVHREGEKTFDISADLHELSKNSVAVVCAGAKSILDLGLTLEVLETLSVPVIGYQTDSFPAFYSRQSPFPVDYRLDDISQIAKVISTRKLLGQKGGVLVANPIPQESEIPAGLIEQHIQAALKKAAVENIHGKKVTPFLLAELLERTKGQSLIANVSLIKNNAKVAGQLAKALVAPKSPGS